MAFVNLHNQTQYSILDSILTPKLLFNKAKELGQNAVAVTDHGTLAAAWSSLKASKDSKVKLLMGLESYFKFKISDSDERMKHIIFIAKNAIGYKNLLTINKKGFDNNFFIGKRIYPVIDLDIIEKHSEGLICLTACGNGIISQLLMNKENEKAEEVLLKLKNIFEDNLAIEVQANNMKRNSNVYNDEIDQQFLNRSLINLGKKHSIKVVPTSNSHYLNKQDHDVHDALLAIGSHQTIYSNFRLKYNAPEFYLKSEEEVKSFFSRNYGEDFAAEICNNTQHFADMCEYPDWIDPKYSNPSGKELPIYPVKNEKDYNLFLEWLKTQSEDIKNIDEDKQYLRYKCEIELSNKFPNDPIYRERLEKELDTIYYCGVSSYMLVVADYINWAKNNKVSVGPGRGSVAGSLVAYLLKIHEADPIKYGLVFERFHNKLKTSYSDIDLDFSQAGRDSVKEYLVKKYGEDHVAHITNLNTITPKVYVKDIARVNELGGSKEEAVKVGNNLADMIPNDMKNIDDVLKIPLLAENLNFYPEIAKYKDIAGKLRALSTHAGGIVISARPLTGLVPLRKDKDGILSIEYDKDVVEENGLVKLDLLGVSTLDLIDLTYDLIRKNNKEVPEIDFDKYDEKTYDLISSGNTFCVFQFGKSSGTIDLCKKIKPKTIEDLAVITALARPAVKEIREDLIKVKNGKKDMSFIHPLLKEAFASTYGFPLYDESLLILARDVAGWDLGEADKLRKLTKEKGKNPEKALKWKKEFIEGAEKNKVRKEISEKIWVDIVEPYGRYAFNKSISEDELISVYDKNGLFLKNKQIKDIEINDYVRSRDEKTKKDIFVKVNGKYDHGKLPLVEVELITGEKIKCTMNHKFRVKENGEMLPLSQIIKENLTIYTDTAKIDSNINNIKSIKFLDDGQTYDIGVDHPDHQFYMANGMLTSNSHAVVYSMISYKTAYLKAHYPIEFLLANLMMQVNSNAPDAKDNIQKIKKEMRDNKIKILPPDINKSEMVYTLIDDKTLLTGLDALKSVGDDGINDILLKRPFNSFFDFMSKVDSKKVRANTIQALAGSGAIDSFGLSRRAMYQYCQDYRKKLQIWLKTHDPKTETFNYPWAKENEWKISELYALELEYLNEAFICKPHLAYNEFFKENHGSISDIKKKTEKTIIPSIKVIVTDFREFKVKKEASKFYGMSMIKATVEDKFGESCSLTIFPDKWTKVEQRLKQISSKFKFDVGMALHISASTNAYEDEVGLILESLFNAAMIPAKPDDIKEKKKVSLKDAKKTQNATLDLFSKIEDSLYDQGLIDFEDE